MSVAADTEAVSTLQLVVPVHNEGDNVRALHDALVAAEVPFTSLKFVYDFDGDTTLPVIADLQAADARLVASKNEYGRGVLNALRWGFSHAGAGPVVVVMGDNSDRLDIIPEMVRLWRAGATVVSPSRYMRGGEQHGGGFVKSGLSRLAGVSLKLLGFPTADPTNNFKLYDGAWLRAQRIESVGGFEVALELTVKAFEQGCSIVELPTVWRDRTFGQSNFRLFKWLPHYLSWYFRAIRALLFGPKR